MRLNKETVEKFHTRKLLKILNNLRTFAMYFDDAETKEVKDEIDLIKEVLSTREHIPNKKEAKIIRQKAAKKKK